MVMSQAERIAVVETKVDNIETKVDGLHLKLDHFIECADDKYAEKTRVNLIESKVNKHENRLAYYAGGLAVLLVLMEVATKLFLG